MMRFLTAAAAASLAFAALPAAAQDVGSWIVRGRAVQLNSANKDSVAGGALNLSINDKTIPEVDFTYFYTPNLAVELILTVPQKHTLYTDGTALGLGGQTKVATLKHLPPTVTAQYHFTGLGGFRPYLGAGLNYTRFSNVEWDATALGVLKTKLGVNSADLKRNSFGLALQAGVDVPVGGGWLLNLDIKKVQIGTTVSLNGSDAGKFKVDPTLIGLGLGKRF